jgi:hypothetical protein
MQFGFRSNGQEYRELLRPHRRQSRPHYDESKSVTRLFAHFTVAAASLKLSPEAPASVECWPLAEAPPILVLCRI